MLKLICDLKTTTPRVCSYLQTYAQHQKPESLSVCMLPAEVEQEDALPSCSSSHAVDKCSFYDLFSTMFSTYFFFVGWLVGDFDV